MAETFSGGDISAAMTAASAPAASSTPAASPAADTSGSQASTGTAPTQPAATEGTSQQQQQTTSTTEPAQAATVAQDAATQQVEVESSAGPIPFERHKAALENAREKVRNEEFGWAKGIDRGEFEQARSWIELGNRDPLAAVDRIVQVIARDPNGAAALRSYMGRMLGLGRRQAAPQQGAPQGDDERPGPDIPTSESNGQPVVYSDRRMQELLAWQQRRFEAMVSEKLSPLEEERQTRARAEAKARQDAAAQQYATMTLSSLEKQPGFKEHRQEIATAYSAIPVDDPRSEGEKLRDAYLQVVGSKRDQTVRQQTVEDIRRKPAANTVPTGSNASAAPFDYRKATMEEALRYEWNKRKAASGG